LVYGVDNPSKNENIINKRIKSRINSSIEEIKNEFNLEVLSYDGGEFYIKCEKCGLKYSTNRNLLRSRIKEVFNKIHAQNVIQFIVSLLRIMKMSYMNM